MVFTYDPDATNAEGVVKTINGETTFNLSLIEIKDVEPQGGSALNDRLCCLTDPDYE